jgi:hypothetical protein
MTQNYPVIKLQNLNFDRLESHTGLITPELAKQLLELNCSRNRSLNPSRVRFYAQSMLDGEWSLSQPINLSVDGQLIDGQHRLSAVVSADLDVPFIVMTGFPVSSAILMDIGMSRNALHTAKFLGYSLSSNHLSLTRFLIHAHSGKIDHHFNLSPSLVVKVAEEHKSLLEFCVTRRKTDVILYAPVLACVASAYYYENHERLKEFLDCWNTGLQKKPGQDDAAVALRNLYYQNVIGNSNRGHQARTSFFRKAQSALQAFLKGKSLKIIRETSEVLWDVPSFDIVNIRKKMLEEKNIA